MRSHFILFQVIFFCFASFSQSNSWLKHFGGSGMDGISKIATDNNGNIFCVGYISDTVDFDPGPGITNVIDTTYWSGFLCKLDPLGDLIWVRHFPSKGPSNCNKLEVDGFGNAYISGQFHDTIDIDPGPGVVTLTTNSIDNYLCKFNSSGDLVWGRSFGIQGFNNYSVNNLKADTLGNIYFCGDFYGILDLDPGPGVYTVQTVGNSSPFARSDCYIGKLDNSGNLIWAKTFGGSEYDHVASLNLDSKGNICLVGTFQGVSDLDPGPANYYLQSPGESYSFYVMKLSIQGDLKFIKPFYGDVNWNCAFALDKEDNFYCTGYFKDEMDFEPGQDKYILRSLKDYSSFILKLDSMGNFKWVRSDVVGRMWQLGAVVDKNNNAIVIGLDQSGFVEIYSSNRVLICETHTNCYFSSTYSAGDDIFLAGVFFNKQNLNLFGKKYDLTSNGNSDFIIAKLPLCKIEEENVLGINSISIYPNPSNGNLTAYSPLNVGKKCLIEAYNVLGEKMFSKYTDVCNSSEEFSLSNYPKGVYFVRIDYSGTIFSEKIILQ